MDDLTLIDGGTHSDLRGVIKHFNHFDMQKVKRMYHTIPSKENPIRAWQGHQSENKWFYCIAGSFDIKIIRPDDWTTPSQHLDSERFKLDANAPKILHVPGGYITGFRSLIEASEMIIFSDHSLSESLKDDYRYDQDYWTI